MSRCFIHIIHVLCFSYVLLVLLFNIRLLSSLVSKVIHYMSCCFIRVIHVPCFIHVLHVSFLNPFAFRGSFCDAHIFVLLVIFVFSASSCAAEMNVFVWAGNPVCLSHLFAVCLSHLYVVYHRHLSVICLDGFLCLSQVLIIDRFF